jgi:putative nucleotidyltransferase with HDIG domain
VLEEVGKKINKFDDLHSFLNFIVENISKKMGIRTASIFLKEDKNFYKAKAYSNELKDRLQNCRFSSQKGLFKFFCQEEKEIEEESPLLAKLPLEEQEQITKELNLLGATVSIPVVSQGEVLGAINLSEKKNGEISSAEDLNLWQALSGELAIVIRNVSLYQELKNNYFDTIKALIETVEAKDPYTRGHCLRVTEYAINIARELKVEEEEIKQIQYAGILHDIGKIGLMEDILRKPGQLTDEEYSFIKKHPVIGERIIAPIRFLEKIKPIIRHHHERYDGKGYPDGLKGDKIPFFSRILAIADSYDAMTSNRPYRKSLGHEKACLEIKNNAGKQFDPAIVPVACEVLEKIQGKLEV